MKGSILARNLSTVRSERAYPIILVFFGMRSSLYRYLVRKMAYLNCNSKNVHLLKDQTQTLPQDITSIFFLHQTITYLSVICTISELT